MKLKLIHTLQQEYRDSWRWMAIFQVIEGETLAQHMARLTPEDTDMDLGDVDDWAQTVFKAAAECGIHIREAGSGMPGLPFANFPIIEEWDEGARPTMFNAGENSVTKVHAHFLTIRQSGGLDV